MKHISKRLSTLAVVALLFIAPFAFADIKIGVAAPYSNAQADFGEQLWRGASQAMRDINAKGGINGEKLVPVKGDSPCDAEEAVKVANQLVKKDKVVAVVGHFCSSSTIAASEIYAKADVLMVTPSSTNPKVTDRRLPGIFRVCGRDDQQGTVAGNYIVDTLKAKRVVFLHNTGTYGQGLADATRATLKSRGVEAVLYEGLVFDDEVEEDFSALVTKIRALNAEVVYFGGSHSEAGPLVRQLREQGSDAWFISGDGLASEKFVKSAGDAKFLTKVLMTFGPDPRNAKSNPAGVKLVKRFRAQGYEPEGYTLYAYTAVQVIAAALENGGVKAGGAKQGNWLQGNSVPSVTGVKAFDAKGDLKFADYVIYQWKTDGTYSQL